MNNEEHSATNSAAARASRSSGGNAEFDNPLFEHSTSEDMIMTPTTAAQQQQQQYPGTISLVSVDSDYGSVINHTNPGITTNSNRKTISIINDDEDTASKHQANFDSISIGAAPANTESPPAATTNDNHRHRKIHWKNSWTRSNNYIRAKCVQSTRSCCSNKAWLQRLPILRWLPRYSRADATGDLVAGITVGLTVVPQSLAYAAIAGLPLEYGLYSSFMGCFVYCLLGTSKDVAMGTAALTSLLTQSVINKLQPFSPRYAVLTCFCVGIVQIAMGLLRLGILIDFVSTPVLKGFVCSGALIIASEQIRNVLGIQSRRGAFYITIYDAFANIGHANWHDVVMAAASFAVLIALKYLTFPLVCRVFCIRTAAAGKTASSSSRASSKKGSRITTAAPTRTNSTNNLPPMASSTAKPAITAAGFAARRRRKRWLNVLRITVRMISLCRNALVVVLASVAAYLALLHGKTGLTLSAKVPPGLPPFRAPPFTFPETNRTAGDLLETAGGSIVILAILSLLINISVGKALGARNGYYVDSQQEFFAVGIGNVLSSFVSSYPISTSFSRASLNNDCGVRTPAAGILTGGMVILALSLLAKYFMYIPRAALGAVIICAVLPLFESDVFAHTWRINKMDMIPLLATMLGAFLLGSEYGIIIGVGISLLILLYRSARPKINVTSTGGPEVATNTELFESNRATSLSSEVIVTRTTALLPSSAMEASDDDTNRPGTEVVVVTPYGALSFPSADRMRDLLVEQFSDDEETAATGSAQHATKFRAIILDAVHVSQCDYTSTCAFRDALLSLKQRNIHVMLVALRPHMIRKLTAAGIKQEHFPMVATAHEAIQLLRERQAQQIAAAAAASTTHTATAAILTAAQTLRGIASLITSSREQPSSSESTARMLRRSKPSFFRESSCAEVPPAELDDESLASDSESEEEEATELGIAAASEAALPNDQLEKSTQ